MKEYIKREDAINLLWLFADESCASVVSDFESLPAADVAEVRHGRWIISEMNFGYCDIIQKEYIAKKYTCSECGYETGEQAKKYVCCPICMARMDKEVDHEAD